MTSANADATHEPAANANVLRRAYAFVPQPIKPERKEGLEPDPFSEKMRSSIPEIVRSDSFESDGEQVLQLSEEVLVHDTAIFMDGQLLHDPQLVPLDASTSIEPLHRAIRQQENLDKQVSQRLPLAKESRATRQTNHEQSGTLGEDSTNDGNFLPASFDDCLILVAASDLTSFMNWAETNRLVQPDLLAERVFQFDQSLGGGLPPGNPQNASPPQAAPSQSDEGSRSLQSMGRDSLRANSSDMQDSEVRDRANQDLLKSEFGVSDNELNGEPKSSRPPRLEQPSQLNSWYAFRVRVIHHDAGKNDEQRK